MPSRKPLWLIAAPVIFLLLWSGGFSVAKLGITHAEPLSFLAVRYASVCALLAPLVAIMRPPLPKTMAEWMHLAIVGVLIQTVYFGLSYIAFKAGVSAGGVAIIVCLQPILVGLIAPRFAGERVGLLRWIGLALGLLGAATVILSRSSVELEHPLGVAAACVALLAITAGTLWEKRFGKSHHPVVSNAVQYLAGLMGVMPFALAFETFSFEWNMPFVAALAYLVIGNSIIAMSLLLAMIRAGEVSRCHRCSIWCRRCRRSSPGRSWARKCRSSAGPASGWQPSAWPSPAASQRQSDLRRGPSLATLLLPLGHDSNNRRIRTMAIDAKYTAHATSVGGRGGGTAKTSDGALDVKLDHPKELGGKGDGVNPEQLFAIGYSSCYLGAMKFVAANKMTPPVKLDAASSATAHVSFGPRDDGQGFGLAVVMDVSLPGVDKAVAQEIADKAHVVCPYSHATRGNISVTTNIL